jgi:hypothetical protein
MTQPFGETNCISIENIPEFQHSYTVIRTSGEMQNGWTLGCSQPLWHGLGWVKHHAYFSPKGWRLMLTDSNEWSGWRPINTIWPTALEGDEVAIQAWRDKAVSILESISNPQNIQ